jgi:hypothetical protein
MAGILKLPGLLRILRSQLLQLLLFGSRQLTVMLGRK